MKGNAIVILGGLMMLIVACKDQHKQTTKNINIQSKEFQDKLIEANKMYVRQENDEIDQYVAHKGWDMVKTGTGLRYMITRKGSGELAKPEQIARVNYKISLLNGTVCYSSDSTGAKEFVVAGDNVESGLHEGIQYMHIGDKAILILPSHLAHGLMGDEDKIPPKASVIYELELLSLK
ncbi:MAG TPA: FKBP-type peptidyl-prolyl cis-trans isomerase [Chitinophagales bacterium]|nr:FKBP-type peptidyl-prolyl cis-trans isomerase [Chitinophagales bacterium]